MNKTALGSRQGGLEASRRFGAAWVAAFLGVLLIIGVAMWAIWAMTLSE